MNAWLLAATALLLGLATCGFVVARKGILDRLVALELASSLAVLTLMLLAQGLGRPTFYDLALTLAVLSFSASLGFARMLERWL